MMYVQVEAHADIVARAEHEAARVAEERQVQAAHAAELAARVRLACTLKC